MTAPTTWVRLAGRLHDVHCDEHGVVAVGVSRYRDALRLAVSHQASHEPAEVTA